LKLLKELSIKYSAEKLFVQKDMKCIVKVISSPDSSLKSEAFELLNEIYKSYGESIWNSLGDLPSDILKLLRKKFVLSTKGTILSGSIEASKSRESIDTIDVGRLKNVAGDYKVDETVENMNYLNEGGTRVDTLNRTDCVKRKRIFDDIEANESLKKENSISVDESVKLDKSLVVAEELKETVCDNTRNRTSVLKSAEVLSTKLNNLQRVLLKTKESDTSLSCANQKEVADGNGNGVGLEESDSVVKNGLGEVEASFALRTPNPKFKGPFNIMTEYTTVKYEASEKDSKEFSMQSIKTEKKDNQNQASHFNKKEHFPITEPKEQNLNEVISNLKSTEIRRKANALIQINKRIYDVMEREGLIRYSEELYDTFTEVLKTSFAKSVQDIPIRFLKYFATVIVRVCSDKIITTKLSEVTYSHFVGQLIKSLLYEGLDNEGEYLLKAFHVALVKILENADPNISFVVFFNLLRNVKEDGASLIIAKSILKLAKNMNSSVSVSKVLLAVHEYLSCEENKSNESGFRVAKTVVNELIKVRGENLWMDYKVIEVHSKPDVHIKSWLTILLKPIPINESKAKELVQIKSPDDLKGIFRGLSSQVTFQDAIRKLKIYTQRHPEISIEKYFITCSKEFKEYVMNSLKKFETNDLGNAGQFLLNMRNNEEIEVANAKSISSASEYKSKLALLKQKFDIGKH